MGKPTEPPFVSGKPSPHSRLPTNAPTKPAWDPSSFGWNPIPVNATVEEDTTTTNQPPIQAVHDDDADMEYHQNEPSTQSNFDEWLERKMPWLNNELENTATALNNLKDQTFVQVSNNITNINIQVDQSSNVTNETIKNTFKNQSTSSNTVNNNVLNQTAKISAAGSSSQQIREDLCAADEIINNAANVVPVAQLAERNRIDQDQAAEDERAAEDEGIHIDPAKAVAEEAEAERVSIQSNKNGARPSQHRSITKFYGRKGCTSPQAKVPSSKLRALKTWRKFGGRRIKKFINDKVKSTDDVVATVSEKTYVPAADEEYDRVRTGTSGKYIKMTGKRGNSDDA